MKKLFFFLFGSMFLCSCSCMLSQIPPQYIYAGGGCTAPLPDYRNQVTVTGGCTGFSVTQFPMPGTTLTADNKQTDVIITATGTNQKKSSIRFSVTMIDTVTPKITPIGALVAYQETQLKEIYDAGDKIAISMFKSFDKAFPWDTATLNHGGGPWTDSVYLEKMLVSVSMDSAGTRKRVTTFGDSVIIDPSPYLEWANILNKPESFYPVPHSHLWDNIINAPDTTRWQYMVDYREFYDWMAYGEYIPIPKRTPATNTTPPNMELVHAGYNFTPLIFDPLVLKMKFWNGSVWKTITSN